MYSQSTMVAGDATSTMPNGNRLTMSSREITELTGKEHKNVNSKSLQEIAKILNMPEKSLIEALIRDKFLIRQSGNLLPYSRPSIRAYFTVKTGSSENEHAYSQTRVTAEGISWIASRYASELMVD